MKLPSVLAILGSRRIGVMLPLGFASGLPLALTGGTLQAWLTVEGIDLSTIGWFSLVGVPYVLKFLWAPVMDRFVPPWLGRRRGWMIVTQAVLILGVVAMALTKPLDALSLLGLVALVLAFLSASQDIVFDAYRTDLLQSNERGFGAAIWVVGYRVALLIASSVALIMASKVGWQDTYLAMAGLMVLGMITILWSPEPETPPDIPATLKQAVWEPIAEFISRPAALGFVVLMVIYKLGDALAAALTTPFFINGVGFTLDDVGYIKGFGLGATLLGAMVGAAAMMRLGLFGSLLAFGVLQAVSNLAFLALAWSGKSYAMLVVAVAFENVTGGMGTTAFVALVMSLCDHRYTATQFAVLTSLEALNRVLLGGPAAKLVNAVGWESFFLATFLAALPGLWVLWRLRSHIGEYGPRGH
ncbi:MAG: AmpG family muropeptide MFS transporter [Methyloceanibacter sp.]